MQPVVPAHPDTDPLQTTGRLQDWQEASLKAHTQFLSNDGEYIRLYGQITKQELDLLAGNPSQQNLEQINAALVTLDRSMTQFHQHQAETLRVHEQYLQSQAELINNLAQFQNISAARPVTRPSEPRPVSFSLPEPVAPKSNGNGHTAVKPKGNGNGHVPVDPGGNGHNPIQPGGNGHSQAAPAVTSGASISAATPPRIDLASLTEALLEIISDKTGYPTEMLEMGMDMESDLGIDSIKRVEILGAMQARYPELPKANTTVLADLRTIGQVVEQMMASAPSSQLSNPGPEAREAPVSSKPIPTSCPKRECA